MANPKYRSIPIDEAAAREILDGDSTKFVVVEDGEWVDDGKYSMCEIIVKDPETGTHYCANFMRAARAWMRAGSYYADYEFYMPEELLEVVPKERVTVEWVAIPVEE